MDNIRILVVDDEPLQSRLLKLLLEPYGDVDTSTTIPSPKTLNHYHLVITDLYMPPNNAWAVLANLKQTQCPPTCVVVSSADDDLIRCRHQLERCGATLALPKSARADLIEFVKALKVCPCLETAAAP